MYLDPAFGGMLVQVIIAIVAVGGGLLYALRRKIRTLFSKKNKDETKSSKPKHNKAIDAVIDSIMDDATDKETKK